MSGNETGDELSRDQLAFEYVAGTLRGAERRAFETSLDDSPELRASVRFWEEQLMTMESHVQGRAPQPETWERIAATISPRPAIETSKQTGWRLSDLWHWGMPSVAATFLFAVLWWAMPGKTPGDAGLPDYLAVLTDESGAALVTALTTQGDNTSMQFKWEGAQFRENTHAQLWAISRRDGQARPLAVLESADIASVALDTAAWRLVTDAEYLILTEEEEGGSALDEPSDTLLAKGFCVRLTRGERQS